jgi:hypothetical protein
MIQCGPGSMFHDECLTCGGWASAEIPGGYSAPNGWRFCSEDCLADYQERTASASASQEGGNR